MDAVSDPLIEEVVVMKSAQVGWTEIINNIVGYFIDQDPSPIMVMQPTLDMAEAWSTDRLTPMVRDTPRLRVKIAEAKSRDSGNKLLQKRFPGGQLVIVGANSPSSLASRPMRVILAIDTGDGYSTTSVYAWARRHPRVVMAIKGIGSFSAAMPVMGPTWVDVTVRGTKVQRGVQLWTVAVSLFKSETYDWLKLDQPIDGEPYPPGYIHLPQGVDAEWLQQLVAEQLVTVKNKRTGFSKREWQKTRDRNEAIDCRVYARAAAYALGLDRWSAAKWAKATGVRLAAPEPPEPDEPGGSTATTPPARPPARPPPAPPKPRSRTINPLTGKPRGSHFGRR